MRTELARVRPSDLPCKGWLWLLRGLWRGSDDDTGLDQNGDEGGSEKRPASDCVLKVQLWIQWERKRSQKQLWSLGLETSKKYWAAFTEKGRLQDGRFCSPPLPAPAKKKLILFDGDNFGNSQPIYDISTVRLAEMTSEVGTHANGRPCGMSTCRRASKQGRRGEASVDRGTGQWSQGGPISCTRAVNQDKCKLRHRWDETSHPLSKRKKKKEYDKHWPGGGSGETGTLTNAGGNVKWYSCYWKQMSLKKLNNNPAIPLVGILPKELKAWTQTDICTPKFTAAFHNSWKTQAEYSRQVNV